MIRSRYEIELKDGVKVEMLFTLALFGVAKRHGLSLEIDTDASADERLTYYVKLMYAAALLAWEYRSFDEPGLGDFPYKLIDFGEWTGNHPLKFAKLIKGASSAIAGEDIDENQSSEVEDVKKK